MDTKPQNNRSFKDNIDKQKNLENRRYSFIILKMAVILITIMGIAAICLIIKINNSTHASVRQESDEDNIQGFILPDYEGKICIEINNNIPYFDLKGIDTKESFELYSDLDGLGRCGTAFANISRELMPTEERGEIGMVKPSGWHTVKYPDVIEDLYLYNRCHLIAYSLTGENANELNLITGTRFFNVNGMLPFESMVKDYIERTNNHVLYRVTPIFENNDLVARGVIMEAYSIEDKGTGICFNVFVFNIQPGIEIDYSDGSSKLAN